MNAAIPERRPVTEQFSGLIERVTFHNEENGFWNDHTTSNRFYSRRAAITFWILNTMPPTFAQADATNSAHAPVMPVTTPHCAGH